VVDGTIDVGSFTKARLQDPQLSALMQRITVDETDDMNALYPDAAPSRVTVRLKDGTTTQNEIHYPKGHHEAPLSSTEVEEKFRSQFRPYRDDAKADAMIELIGRLDAVEDIDDVFTAFA
jgi:2-methylcitrate dehydratase